MGNLRGHKIPLKVISYDRNLYHYCKKMQSIVINKQTAPLILTNNFRVDYLYISDRNARFICLGNDLYSLLHPYTSSCENYYYHYTTIIQIRLCKMEETKRQIYILYIVTE